MKKLKTKVLIIGAGTAGYSASIYAGREFLNPILIQGNQPGGQLTMTNSIENYPGFPDSISGTELMNNMALQATKVGSKIISDSVQNIVVNNNIFTVTCSSGDIYETLSVIIATGAQAKWLGLKSEKQYTGFGVSSCATCDGFFYKNEEVIVVGGGNTAVEEAIYLTRYATKVTLIHRRNNLRAEKILQNKLFSHPKINILWDSIVTEIIGTTQPRSAEGVKITNLLTGEKSTLKARGIFIAIGHQPNTEIFKGLVDMDEDGYIITAANSTRTSVEGIYAAGDVQDKIYRQAITAAGTGCMSALEVSKFLEDK